MQGIGEWLSPSFMASEQGHVLRGWAWGPSGPLPSLGSEVPPGGYVTCGGVRSPQVNPPDKAGHE